MKTVPGVTIKRTAIGLMIIVSNDARNYTFYMFYTDKSEI